MAVSTKLIKSKIASVKNVGKITKAMELVSVSKMQKSIQYLKDSKPYAESALEVLSNISAGNKRDHQLLQHGDNAKNLVILISSNRGLCGSYNARVAKAATEYVNRAESKHDSKVDFICIGRYAETAARRLRRDIKASFQDFDEKTSYADTLAVSKLAHDLFETGEYYNVVILYTNFISTLASKPVARQLLPVKPENVMNMLGEVQEQTKKESLPQSSNVIESEVQFEPSESEVLDFVLRRLTDIQIFHGLRESQASEHSSRMVAMKNATENSNKLADELKLTYNRARQAAITQEISEIASGAEALSG